MWEEVGKISLYVLVLLLAGTTVWLALRKKGRDVSDLLRETADVIDSFLDGTAPESEEGVKFSPQEWENFKKQIREAIESGKKFVQRE